MSPSCLLFPDNIVLIAKSEYELNLLLSLADQFARKWNLSFNHGKFKIMIFGHIPRKNGPLVLILLQKHKIIST